MHYTKDNMDAPDYRPLPMRVVKKPRKPWKCDMCDRTLSAGTPKLIVPTVVEGEMQIQTYCEDTKECLEVLAPKQCS